MKDKISKIKTDNFIKTAFITTLLLLPFGAFYDTKIVLIILFAALLMESHIIWKEKLDKEILIALLFGLIITSYYSYTYTTPNIMIGRINLFPLISWTFGLVFIRESYKRINVKYKMPLMILFYWTLLLSLEYIFYNFFGVQLNSNYPGLFGLDLIHAQPGMKFFYITAGPIYLILTKYLKLK